MGAARRYPKRLGLMVKVPQPGSVKTRLIPPLDENQAARLSWALLADSASRLAKLKKVSVTVFVDGATSEELDRVLPEDWPRESQKGADLGERMLHALEELLEGGGAMAVLLGGDSPDVPLKFVKRAYKKLKHKDVVIGPSADGGYYLIGMKEPRPELFEGIEWGSRRVFRETLARVESTGLSLSLLPLWYDVDDEGSLELLGAMAYGKRLEGSTRLVNVERALEEIRREDR